MSNGAGCASTRAIVVDPSGRRMLTLVLDDTTCTFVTMVSDVTKNPEPRPDDVSTTTTAGEARLTRSSSDAAVAAGVEGSASSGALTGGSAGAGVSTTSAVDGAVGSPGLTSGSGRTIGLAAAVTVRSSAGRGRINHQPPPAPTTANATIMRATAAPVLSVPACLASSIGEVAADWRLEPHRQVSTLGGTRRPHSEHTQLAEDGSRSLTINFSAVYRSRRLTHVYRFSSAKACLADLSAEAHSAAAGSSGRLASEGGSDLPADLEVQLQDRRPERVVLLVERDLAAPIGSPRLRRRRSRRSATLMDDLDVGREQHTAAPCPDRRTEVHVLRIHEIPFVEQPNRLGITPPDEDRKSTRLNSSHLGI